MDRRRSTRLKQNDDRPKPNTSPQETARKPQKKRARVVAKTSERHIDTDNKGLQVGATKRKAGKLRDLPGMPLDILFIIFSYLHPLDILHLSRTSKGLRDMLMRRSARCIWTTTLATVERLPKCPSDLTEPAYVHLAFNNTCFFCRNNNVKTVYWALRIRCCNRCRSTRLVEESDLARMDFTGTALKFEKWEACAKQALPFHVTDEQKGPWDRQIWYRKSTATQLGKELQKIINDDNRVKAVLEQRRAIKIAVQQHAAKCQAWYETQLKDRTWELQRARDRRRTAIHKKLREAGWTDVIVHMNAEESNKLYHHPLVHQPKDLTDRIWNNIKDALTEYMQEVQSALQERRRRAQLASRVRTVRSIREEFSNSCPNGLVVPGIADLCFMKPFKSILELPAGVDVQESAYAEAEKRLPELCVEWRESAARKLLALLPPEVPGESSDPGRLDLAISVFRCPGCYNAQFLHPVEALRHSCFSVHDVWSDSTHSDLKEFCKLIQEVPWRPFTMPQFSPRGSEAVQTVVKMCGKDPQSATQAEVGRLNLRFGCDCRHGSGGENWSFAAQHLSSAYDCAGLKLIEGEELAKILQTEERRSWVIFSCSVCDEGFLFEELKTHLSAAHGIEQIERRHWYR